MAGYEPGRWYISFLCEFGPLPGTGAGPFKTRAEAERWLRKVPQLFGGGYSWQASPGQTEPTTIDMTAPFASGRCWTA